MALKKDSNPINLNCYTIRFNLKNQSEFSKIKDVFAPDNFKAQMSNFVKTYDTLAYQNDDKSRILYLAELLRVESDLISGVMKRGHNGQESDIDEIVKGKPNTVNSVKPSQFNSIYFYFLIFLPNADSDYLIFIAQTYKQYGFKDLFTESYKQYTKSRFADKYTCSINTLTVPKLFSKYIKDGDIRKLRFKSHSLPENLENILGNMDNKKVKDYEVELSIRAKREGFKNIKNIDFSKTAFVELYDVGFEYADVYADISINGRTRAINITNPEKFAASYDVTDRVSRNNDTQRPIYKDLDKEAIKILKEEILVNI